MPFLVCTGTSCTFFLSFQPAVVSNPRVAHALVDGVANDSLSHECPDGYTAHIVDDRHLQSATAELTVSRHVVVSKWSKSFLFGFRFCPLFICAFIIFT